MSTSKEDFLVQCPYYREDGAQVVRCEGVSRGNNLQLSFNGKRVKKAYKDRHCRDAWITCPIAKMLNEKYDYKPV